MKIWAEPPRKEEVEDEVRRFFDLLRDGEIDAAREAVVHHSDDWEPQLWSLWQDTYLVYLEEVDREVDDDSLEGGLWRGDLDWLQDLGVAETFHWDEPGQRVAPRGEHFSVNLIYRGEVVDVSADFRVVVGEAGGYLLQREIIHMS